MTSEQDNHSAIWEEPNAISQDQQTDISSMAATPDEHESMIPEIETDEMESQDAQYSRQGKISGLARQFSPILVPLPFALLIFLFTLPFALREQTYLPLLPLGVLLIALVVMQGTLLYYVGSNDTYWTLCVIVGYSVFLVVGALAIFGPTASLILLLVLLFVGSFLFRRSIRSIPEGYVYIVLMFGRYARTLQPGLNFVLPWEKISGRMSTKEISWTCPEQIAKISRDLDIKLKATIGYQLLPEDAHIAALQVDNWEEALHKLFVSTLQGVINELTPADFVNWQQGINTRASLDTGSISPPPTTRWDRINGMLAKRVQDQVMNWGVEVKSVNIHDITPVPHLTSGANPVAGVTTRPVDAGVTRGANPAAAQPLPAQVVVNQQMPPQAPQIQQALATSTAPGMTNIETLIGAYEAVRTGRVKDPKTIRDIARSFEALVNDPNITFDAARAAHNLHLRANMYETKGEEKGRTGVAPDVVTHPDTKERGPANDYRWSGG